MAENVQKPQPAQPQARERRPAPVQYHPRLAQDIDFAIKLCATELPQRVERQIGLSELRECLDSAKLGGEASQYELRDFSMHTLGLPDFAAAPVELAFVDKLRPEGIPPEHGNAPLPLPYCPMYVIETVLPKYDSYSLKKAGRIFVRARLRRFFCRHADRLRREAGGIREWQPTRNGRQHC